MGTGTNEKSNVHGKSKNEVGLSNFSWFKIIFIMFTKMGNGQNQIKLLIILTCIYWLNVMLHFVLSQTVICGS